MEYIDAEAKLQKLSLEKKKHIYNEVKKAIELLHNKDVVFGDLRISNILVRKEQMEEQVKTVLVDFDWCGIMGE
ncbi:3198_t:CDS:1, partial [Paraglomus occultum]